MQLILHVVICMFSDNLRRCFRQNEESPKAESFVSTTPLYNQQYGDSLASFTEDLN